MKEKPAPTFTLITALYNSASWLPEFLDSLAGLDGGHEDVEMIFVNDGSPDECEAIVQTWIAATRAPARLIAKEHGGSGSARNVGLDNARGTWVSFPDPDDVLDSGYLAAVRKFLDDAGDADPIVGLIATKVLQFTDVAANAADDHILGYRYHHGPRFVHLEREPRFFHNHGPSGFYRRELIEKAALRIDLRLRAAFEDAAFEAEYLLGVEDPVIGIVPDALYRYRKRPDSVIGTMWSKPERYTDVVEHGYLRLLRLRPRPPLWLQNFVLYDLWWFLYEYEQPASENRAMGHDVARAFLALLDEVLRMIDERVIYGYCLHPLPLHRRTALAARKSGRLLRREARIIDDDLAPPRIRISYFALPGEDPEKREVITVDGIVHQPLEATNRAIEYYGETFIVERELLLDAPGTVMIEVDGEIVPLVRGLSCTGALFPWDHGARAETGVDAASEAPPRGGGSAFGTAVRNTRLGALALEPRRIRPAFARRVGRLRMRLPTLRQRGGRS